MSDVDYKNIDDIKTILKTMTIKDFFKSGFKDFNMLDKIKKDYFSICASNEYDYLIYKSFNGEVKIKNEK